MKDIDEKPRITVGITCYNAADTIGRAIQGALGQEWHDIEVIVVDDASLDESQGVLREWAARDERIRVRYNEANGGCAAARNQILEHATGELIAFFDDDDFSAPARLNSQYRCILEYEKRAKCDLVACYASGVRRYPNGYELELQAIGSQAIVPVGAAVADYLLSFDRLPGVFYGAGTPACALMARRSTFLRVGGFDSEMRRMEDVDFAVRFALLGGHFIGTIERTLIQFATIGSDKAAAVEHQSFVALLNKNRSYLESKGRYGYCLGWADLRFRHFAGEHRAAFLALMRLLVRYPLRTARHFLKSSSRRYAHERKMRA